MTVLDDQLTDAEALELHEAAAPQGVQSSSSGVIQPDGTVMVHIIRPCQGRGRGRHIYEASMLERHGRHFTGWPMFLDHEAPEARAKAGGLPPSLTRLAGEVQESWWDPTVPAEGRFGQGAVVGRVKPSPMMRDLIEALPNQVQTSINTHATGVRPTKREGQTALLVEGFAPDGSVDFVTKAGAGGKIVRLMEAYYDDDAGGDAPSAEALELAEYLREHRPGLVEALINPTTTRPDPGTTQEDDETMTPEQLREAAEQYLRSDAGRELIAELAEARIITAVQEAIQEALPPAVGSAADVIEAAAREVAKAEVRNGRLADRAQETIAESELHDALKADVASRFATVEYADDVDGDGNVTKSAEVKLDEAVQEAVKAAKAIQEAIGGPAPTVTPGPRRTTVSGAGGTVQEADTTGATHDRSADWRHDVKEAGIDPAAAWGVPLQESETDADKAKREAETATATA